MGFNIGVSSLQKVDCDDFVDREFYNFVASREAYGDKSILSKVAEYYNIDLTPLSKIVYTWDNVKQSKIIKNLQETKYLIQWTEDFRDKIIDDNLVCRNIEYVWYSIYREITKDEYNIIVEKRGEDYAKELRYRLKKDSIEQKKFIKENPNPWQSYFEDKRILNDLECLLKILKCFENKQIEKVFLIVG